MHKIFEYTESGKLYAAEKKYDLAKEMFCRIIAIDPENEGVLFELGKIHYILKEYAKAEEILSKLYRQSSMNRYALLLLGKTYKEMGRQKEGIKVYEDIVKKDLSNDEVYKELGDLYRDEKDYELSIRMYEKYLEKNPEKLDTILQLAQLYNFTGQYECVKHRINSILNKISNYDIHRTNQFLNELEIAENKLVLESKPRNMLVTLTNRCNLNCRMCGRGNSSWDMDDRLVDEIIAMLPYLEHVTWHGGEVFLYLKFAKILKEASKYEDLKQTIITNGLLLSRRWAEQLVLSHKMDIIISIDGFEKKTYEELRVGGKFEVLLDNLKILNDLREKHSSKVSLTLRFTVMKENYRELGFAVEFAKKYGFNIVHIYPVDDEEDITKESESIFVKRDYEIMQYLDSVRKQLSKQAVEHGIILLDWLPDTSEYDSSQYKRIEEGSDNASIDRRGISGAEPLSTGKEGESVNYPRCFKPWRQLSVKVNGDILPEPLCLEPLGSIFRNTFSEIWNGEKMQEYRRNILNGSCKWCRKICLSNKIPPEYLKFAGH